MCGQGTSVQPCWFSGFRAEILHVQRYTMAFHQAEEQLHGRVMFHQRSFWWLQYPPHSLRGTDQQQCNNPPNHAVCSSHRAHRLVSNHITRTSLGFRLGPQSIRESQQRLFISTQDTHSISVFHMSNLVSYMKIHDEQTGAVSIPLPGTSLRHSNTALQNPRELRMSIVRSL